MKGETRTPEFLAKVNANGRIPVLQAGDRFIPESNAACFYLADGSPLIPADRFDRADMLRWMFWEQYNHEPNVATLRFWHGWVGEANLTDAQRAQLPAKRAAGEAALALMDEHLAGQRLLRRRGPDPRRHRALRLHPCRRGRRLPARRLSERAGLARPGRGGARLRADGRLAHSELSLIASMKTTATTPAVTTMTPPAISRISPVERP